MNLNRKYLESIYNQNSPDFLTDNFNAINELLIYYKIPEDKFEIEILFDRLSLEVPIKWDNYVIIARALNKIHPQIDLININDDNLLIMINSLPNFNDTQIPKDADYYTAIFTVWAQLRDRV